MENSNIEWTDHTFNPWWGCMKVSAGCKNCYAETLDNRYNHDDPHWGPGSSRKPMSEAYWRQPYKWNEAAKAAGVRAKVFCASMADVFEGHIDTLEHLKRLFLTIEQTPYLNWQLLTKRPENIMSLVPNGTYDGMDWCNGFPGNVWIGTSVENQEAANKRIPYLIEIPAKIRFLSCEPLLGVLDLTLRDIPSWDEDWKYDVLAGREWARPSEEDDDEPSSPQIHWVIAGGESGHNARPVHPDWIRSLRDQCAKAGTAFFFKQWGEYAPGEKGRLYRLRTIDFSDGQQMVKVGKKTAGAVLDGIFHKEFPKT